MAAIARTATTRTHTLGQQDVAGVPGEEAEPAAGREPLLTPGILVSALPELRCAAELNAAGAFPGTEGRDEGELSAGAPTARLLAFGAALPPRRGDFCLRLGARGRREPDGGEEGARDLVTRAHLFPLEGRLASSAREREAGTPSWESHCPTGEGLDPHTPSLADFPSYSSGVLSSELKLHSFTLRASSL